MKKIMAILMSCALLASVALVGCGPKEEDPAATDAVVSDGGTSAAPATTDTGAGAAEGE